MFIFIDVIPTDIPASPSPRPLGQSPGRSSSYQKRAPAARKNAQAPSSSDEPPSSSDEPVMKALPTLLYLQVRCSGVTLGSVSAPESEKTTYASWGVRQVRSELLEDDEVKRELVLDP